MTKTSERELRDLLETTQAEAQRLRAELAAVERAGYAAAQHAVQEELQELRALVKTLEKKNASLQAELESTQGRLKQLTRLNDSDDSLWQRMLEFFTRQTA